MGSQKDGAATGADGKYGTWDAWSGVDPWVWEDPCGPGLDRTVVTTFRGVARIATLAGEAGKRFEREGIVHEPGAWMVTPRKIFGGLSAVEACVHPGHFMRGMVLHGAGIGLDAEPGDIDALVAGAKASAFEADAATDPDPGERATPGLFTATLSSVDPGGSILLFHAGLSPSREAYVAALRHRLGIKLLKLADVRSGYDPSGPIAAALVSKAVDDILLRVQSDPTSTLARGLDVHIEQRFEC